MSKHLMQVDATYKDWLQSLGQRWQRSQIKAAVKVNSELLRFNWALGRDIAARRMEARYGSGFYQRLSRDLQQLLSGARSFSVNNLRYMRHFYEMYPSAHGGLSRLGEASVENDQQLAGNALPNFQQPAGDLERADGVVSNQQLIDDLRDGIIFSIPWGHHMLLIDRFRGQPETALFYVRKTLENNWSRAVLLNFLDTGLHLRQGQAVSNFALTLPAPHSDLAQAITRDPYTFDFLAIRERYDERELKDAILANAEKFLLELSNGFAFLGREVRLQVGSTEKFLDLLFYNVRLHCYVVVEVKATEFDASYAGQLGAYVVAVNHQLKTEQDNPTIGLLICKGMDRVEAQYALESSSQPLGISSYQLSKLVPEAFKGSLPTIEEIEAGFSSVDNAECAP